jgi:tyrosyl-tRNA synthetase
VTPVSSSLPLLKRGVVDLIDEKDLARKLERGPVTVKVGFDPSAPDIHLGHTVVLRKMRQFQDTGNRVVFVVGYFTAIIGDPAGKKATRPQLTREQVEENARTYTTQAFRILDEKKTIIEFNGRWLTALGSAGLIRLASKITVARILERDDFQKRWRAQQPIALHELLYPLAQAYDSVALKADVELGGTDQLFNLLVGRDLMREEGLEAQVVLTLPLLVGTDGVEKMSKSLGNAIGIQEPPGEIYGKLISIPDALMWCYYELFTDGAPVELCSRRRRVEKGEENPRDAKADLARTITAQFHGEAEAARAAEDFRRAFSLKGLPEVLERKTADRDWGAAKIIVELGLAASMREARRKIAEGALEIYQAGYGHPTTVVRDPNQRILVDGERTIRLGRRFLHVIPEQSE